MSEEKFFDCIFNKFPNKEVSYHDCIDIKNQFESSLEKFHMTFKKLAAKNEALLKELPEPHHYKQTNDITENTYFNQRMIKYVDDQLDELSQVNRQVTSTLAAARDKLIQERARLPWE